jgi:hypothetical protein
MRTLLDAVEKMAEAGVKEMRLDQNSMNRLCAEYSSLDIAVIVGRKIELPFDKSRMMTYQGMEIRLI